MLNELNNLPGVGDPAPSFIIQTEKGGLHFPEYSQGCWCILFSHPANFTSAWWMYSTFLALKERWFNERNTKLLTLSNEPVRHSEWSDKVRRYIGIYLKAPVIEDPSLQISKLYGMASRRHKSMEFNRLAYIIDPEGFIRLIIHNPLPSIEGAILELERELDRLQQGQEPSASSANTPVVPVLEGSDALTEDYKMKPAYFGKNKLNLN